MIGPRINDQIRISPVRVIDQDNQQVGILETYEAQRMARDAGLDLVEVDPNARPPVCRIQDYGRAKYEKSKRDRHAKQKSHKQELKGIRLRPRIDRHDLATKLKKAREFICKGDKVQFSMRFRGMREMQHTDLGIDIMKDVAAQLADVAKVESPPRREGRRIAMMIAPTAEVQRKLTAERKAREKVAKEAEKALAQARAGGAEAPAGEPPAPKAAPVGDAPAPKAAPVGDAPAPKAAPVGDAPAPAGDP